MPLTSVSLVRRAACATVLQALLSYCAGCLVGTVWGTSAPWLLLARAVVCTPQAGACAGAGRAYTDPGAAYDSVTTFGSLGAGGYKWTFAAPRPKLDAADVQELIDGNYAIQIQQRNPKKAGTKSALLYDQYKGAENIRDMLALGARRADIPYDISHGWVTLVDPTLQKRFSPPPTAAAPDPPSKEAVEAEDDDDEGPPDDPMEEDSENDESREDVLKTLPPRPPPARARSRGAAVNYADPPDF